MITRCVGLSPDGGLGCTRDARHDNRTVDIPCRNASADIVWCSRCDSFNCQHMSVAEALASMYAREARAHNWAVSNKIEVEAGMTTQDEGWWTSPYVLSLVFIPS